MPEMRYLRLACRLERRERDGLVIILSIVLPWLIYAGMFACYTELANESTWRWLFWSGLAAILLSVLLSAVRLEHKVAACLHRPVILERLSGPFFDSSQDSSSDAEISQAHDCRIGHQRIHVPSHWQALFATLGGRPLDAEVFFAPWGVAFPVALKDLVTVEADIAHGLLNYRPLGIGVSASAVVVPICTLVAVAASGIQPARMAGGLFHNPFIVVSTFVSATLAARAIAVVLSNRPVLKKLRQEIARSILPLAEGASVNHGTSPGR